MSNNTITVSAFQALIAAKIDLAEAFPGGVNVVPDGAEWTADAANVAREVNAAAKPAKVDGRNKAARAHNYEARIARRTAPKNARNSKGMTTAERKDLAALWAPELKTARAQSKAAYDRLWAEIVADFKACQA